MHNILVNELRYIIIFTALLYQVNESIPKASRTSNQPMKTWTLAEFTGSHCKIWK